MQGKNFIKRSLIFSEYFISGSIIINIPFILNESLKNFVGISWTISRQTTVNLLKIYSTIRENVNKKN